MRRTIAATGLSLTAVVVVTLVTVAWADPPQPPAMSKVVPAEDLIQLTEQYVEGFQTAVEDEESYAEKGRLMTRDAHTVAVVALVLAHHDEDHRLKAAAPGLLAAAQRLAQAQGYEPAKEAVAGVAAALAGTGGETPGWDKVASLGQVMKQVTFVNNRLRRNIRRFEDRAADNARDAALLAAIAQAVIYDTHEVKDPAEVGKWYECCGEMRDSAGELNSRIHAGDKDGAMLALGKMAKSCDRCHETFRVVTTP